MEVQVQAELQKVTKTCNVPTHRYPFVINENSHMAHCNKLGIHLCPDSWAAPVQKQARITLTF